MGIFGGRFKMGRPNPNFWVWANRRLGIFGDHPVAAVASASAALAALAALARQDGLQGLVFAPYVVFISLKLKCCKFTGL